MHIQVHIHYYTLTNTHSVGAKLATLRKYAEAYQKLFPSSTQVIVAADYYRYWKPASLRVSTLQGGQGTVADATFCNRIVPCFLLYRSWKS